MRRVFAIVGILTILSACSSATPVAPTPTNTRLPTVTPLGQDSPYIVVTRIVIATATENGAAPPTARRPAAPTIQPASPTTAPILATTPTPATPIASSASIVPIAPTSTPTIVFARPVPAPIVGTFESPTPEQHLASRRLVQTWQPVTIMDAPPACQRHTAIWTGSEMIVWGGIGDPYRYLNSGGRYNPATDTWALLPPPGSPSGFLLGRISHSAIWTGSEMIIWGGWADGGAQNNGARYNPSTNSWTLITTTGAPKPRYYHSAVWTGSEMIVWGGTELNDAVLNDGARYNPATDTWRPITTTGAPVPQVGLPAVWTGSEMIVLRGRNTSYTRLMTGTRYNPDTDTWRPITTTNAPYATNGHTAVVWTGSEVVVWGGWGAGGPGQNDGARYSPATDTWRPISTVGIPAERSDYTEVWTGSEMIVWGGAIGGTDGSIIRNDGGRYDPATDTWTAIPIEGAPSPRQLHTAVWADSEMIIWGGWWNDKTLGDGARLHSSYVICLPVCAKE